MKKKILTLLLAFALITTMAAPSFAVTTKNIFSKPTYSYLAIGDSVAAGCKNMNFFNGEDDTNNPGFIPFQKWYTDETLTEEATYDSKVAYKNSNVYAVPNSFVYKVAKGINADQATSYNNAYVGYRLLDACRALGIAEYTSGDYGPSEMTPDGDQYYSSMLAATGEGIPKRENFEFEDEYNKVLKDYSLVQMGQYIPDAQMLFDMGSYWTDPKTMMPINPDPAGHAPDLSNPTTYCYFKSVEEAQKWVDMYSRYLHNEGEYETTGYMSTTTFQYQLESAAMTASVYNQSFKALFNAENTEAFKKAIATSDVITVELGLNDIMAAMQTEPALAELLNNITGMMAPGTTPQYKAKDIAQAAARAIKRNTYYYDKLMAYINKHKKDDAIVVVGTLIDPIRGYKIYDYTNYVPGDEPSLEEMKRGAAQTVPENMLMKSLLALFDPFVSKIFPSMNAHIKQSAVTTKYTILGKKKVRNYYVADLSAVSLNPPAADGITYVQHPNPAGQKYIANAFLAQIHKGQVANGAISNVLKANTMTNKVAQAIEKNQASLIKEAIKGAIYLIKQIFNKGEKEPEVIVTPEDIEPAR